MVDISPLPADAELVLPDLPRHLLKLQNKIKLKHRIVQIRAEGEGTTICTPTEEHNWNNIGSSPASCFAFLCSENLSNMPKDPAPKQPACQPSTARAGGG